jgi:hypothetical protein
MSRNQDEYWRILYIEDDEEDYILIRNWLTKSQVRKIDLTWAARYEEGVLRFGTLITTQYLSTMTWVPILASS